MRYCPPEVPRQYWLTQTRLRCSRCRSTFTILIPESADVVMLREEEGDTIKWLPVYGIGGYLDLLVKLVPDHQPSTEISMKTVKLFEDRLGAVSETSKTGRPFRLDHARRTCPTCGSTEVEEVGETVLFNPPLDWLRVLCNLIKPEA